MSAPDYDPDSLERRDSRLITQLLPALEWLGRGYFRLRWDGAENLPTTPALFVANHNGGIMGPDLFCTLPVLWRQLGPKRPLYALAHDFAMRQFTPLGRALQRVGAIAASRANAERVLAAGGNVLVYPGGDLEAYRSSRRSSEVIIAPRTGFIEVAKKTGVPIVPVVAQGAHRSAYILTEGAAIARLLGLQRWARLQRFPIALALPWLVAVGPWLPYLPLPFPIRLRFLPAMFVGPQESSTAAAARVQRVMQDALVELGR